MKNLTQIFVVVAIVAMLGCSAHKSNTKDNSATQTPANCYTKQVSNGDLYKFLEANQKNPSLNAVKIKVSDVTNALKNYKPDGYIYITIIDTKSYGRSATFAGITQEDLIGVCQGALGGVRCCPPPLPCDPGSINNIQFLNQSVFYEQNEPIDKKKIKKRL